MDHELDAEPFWWEKPKKSDFTFLIGEEYPHTPPFLWRRIRLLEREATKDPSWRGRNDDRYERVIIDLDVSDRKKKGRSRILIEPPSVDEPVLFHSVISELPVDYFTSEPSDPARSLKMISTVEALVRGYCQWRGWPEPGDLTRTAEEESWAAQHGAPEVPEWVTQIKPPRAVKVSTSVAEKLLAPLVDVSIDEAVDAVSEELRKASDQRFDRAHRGVRALVACMGTQAHWEAAGEAMAAATGWGGISDDVFLDLRSYAVLRMPDRATLSEPGVFREVLQQLTDENDLGTAGGLTDLLYGLAEERDLRPVDLPDVRAITPAEST